jgi:hypothetical protein
MPDKERERFYFEMLRRAMPELPSVDPTEPEPPDFLFATAEGALGIEFTAFHLPPTLGDRPHQERQALKERIVTLAEQLHEERGGPSLYVDVHFNDHLALDNKDAVRLAGEIADSVLGSPLPTSISDPVHVRWRTRPKETSRIRIHPTVDPEDRLWTADAGGWVATITSDHLNRVFARQAKDRLPREITLRQTLARYRERCLLASCTCQGLSRDPSSGLLHILRSRDLVLAA